MPLSCALFAEKAWVVTSHSKKEFMACFKIKLNQNEPLF